MEEQKQKEPKKLTGKNMGLALVGLFAILIAFIGLSGLYIVISSFLDSYITGGFVTAILIGLVYFGIKKANE